MHHRPHTQPEPDSTDPRRVPRGAAAQRRDWASATRMVAIPRLRELLATALVRAGLLR